MAARFTLGPVRPGDVPIVRRFIQLYIYDLGGDRWTPERDGTYAPPRWHRRFWRRRGQHHFMMRVDGRPAGFALVRDRADFAGAGVREIAEFFVLAPYRGRRFGTRAALQIFATFPGRWEVSVLTWNPAQRFWRRIIRRVAAGRVVASRRRHHGSPFVVTHFETAPRARR
ncbi:MAG TPA: GNAT family N-acetyltransferase [Methylomirabilota bacterium]|nr:GNAT family N-acetyltransferase [Methylomirabilota bacterium]